jgi:hypothetical protein
MYKYQLEAHIFAYTAPSAVFWLLEELLTLRCSPDALDLSAHIQNLLESPKVINLLRGIISRSQLPLSELHTILSRSVKKDRAAVWVASLLDPTGSFRTCPLFLTLFWLTVIELGEFSLSEKIGFVTSRLDEISLPFSAFALCTFQTCHSSSQKQSDQFTDALVDHLINSASSKPESFVKFELIKGLDSTTKRHVSHAVRFFATCSLMLSKLLETCEMRIIDIQDHLSTTDFVSLSNVLTTCISIVHRTLDAFNHDDDSTKSTQLLEKLGSVPSMFAETHSAEKIDAEEQKASQISGEFLTLWLVYSVAPCYYLSNSHSRTASLLNLSIIHNLPTSSPTTQRPSALDLLITLTTLLSRRTLGILPATRTFLLDVAALCIDTLSDEQRIAFAKADPLRTSDPLLAFLLGHPAPTGPDAWLGLVLSAQLPAPPTTPSSSQQSQGRPPSAIPPNTPRPSVLPSTPPPMARRGQGKAMAPPVPFPLKAWEMLPDPGNVGSSAAAVNDTAVSLALFGARKV